MKSYYYSNACQNVLITDGISIVRVYDRHHGKPRIVQCGHKPALLQHYTHTFTKISRDRAIKLSGSLVKLPFNVLKERAS